MKRDKGIEGNTRKLIETSLGSLFPPKKDTCLNLEQKRWAITWYIT